MPTRRASSLWSVWGLRPRSFMARARRSAYVDIQTILLCRLAKRHVACYKSICRHDRAFECKTVRGKRPFAWRTRRKSWVRCLVSLSRRFPTTSRKADRSQQSTGGLWRRRSGCRAKNNVPTTGASAGQSWRPPLQSSDAQFPLWPSSSACAMRSSRARSSRVARMHS